mmetsp:Transcript_27877/g.61409  ORF Transcript_27877/g.61409 Transcript_27877/m.61409 type:complete len:605 (+) Transcript_27877:54-1868(+)
MYRMLKRWRATIPILLIRIHFFSTHSQSIAVAALQSKLQGARHFQPFGHIRTSPLPTSSYLLAIKDNPVESTNNGANNSSDMIVRVRSNLGTIKLKIEDEGSATESTVRAAVIEERQCKTGKTYKVTQDLSFDPSGLRRINPLQSLHEQGLRHGSMVYCRLEEEISKDNLPQPKDQASIDNSGGISHDKSDEEKNLEKSPGKARFDPKKNDDVIDLMDSSDDEEETNCANQQLKNDDDDDDDDDDVQVISPREIKNIGEKKRSNKNESQVRKRQRLETDVLNPTKSSTTTTDTSNHHHRTHSNFQIASYNVWFGPPDPEAKQVFPKERMAGIVKSLRAASIIKESEEGKTCPLIFVGLQELTPPLVQYLKPHLQNIGYRMCTQPLGGYGASYGIGIAVPEDLVVLDRQFVPYSNSIQGRGFLFVRTPTMLFATTHLESWCGPQFTGSKEREVQVVEVARFCQDQLNSVDGLELAVLAGDLNWDDERKQKKSEPPNRKLLSLLPEGWNDAGTPFDYTYDAKENPMLNGNLRRRLDRCIYTSQPIKTRGSNERRQNFRSTNLQKIGREIIPNLVWNKKNSYNGNIKKMPVSPSDHFGIMISFSNEL